MMENEKRLIDANAFIQHFEECKRKVAILPLYLREILSKLYSEVIEEINKQPTVDAVEVVPCKKCQYWNQRYETMGMCMKHNAIVTFTKPDFYCAWGKDKNDGICKEG